MKRVHKLKNIVVMKLFYFIFFLVFVNSCFSQNGVSNTDIKQCEYYYDSTLEMDIYRTVDKFPEFPGVEHTFYKYIVKNWDIPENEADFHRRFLCVFVITSKGKVINVTINGKEYDEYTITELSLHNLINSMPDWKPAKCNEKDVNFLYRFPIK